MRAPKHLKHVLLLGAGCLIIVVKIFESNNTYIDNTQGCVSAFINGSSLRNDADGRWINMSPDIDRREAIILDQAATEKLHHAQMNTYLTTVSFNVLSCLRLITALVS